MASIQKRVRNGKTTFSVRYRDPTGKSRRKVFKLERQASAFMTQNEGAKLEGAWVDPAAGKLTFGKLADEWFTAKLFGKPATQRMYRQLLENQILPTFAQTPIASIDAQTIEDWAAKLTHEGLSASRVRSAVNVMGQILARAVKAKRLAHNVTKDLDRTALPKRPEQERHYLTVDQVEQLADTIDPRYRTLILFASYTGMRIGEITALKVRDIDFLRRTIRVVANDTEISGRLVSGTPKSGRARTVPVPSFLVELLSVHVAGKDRDAYAFTSPEGRRHRQSAFLARYFHPAVERARLDPEIDFHDLRHTAASLMISAGANVKAVQNALGHASAAMTLDTYADLFDADARSVADRLDSLRSALGGPTVSPGSGSMTSSQVTTLDRTTARG